ERPRRATAAARPRLRGGAARPGRLGRPRPGVRHVAAGPRLRGAALRLPRLRADGAGVAAPARTAAKSRLRRAIAGKPVAAGERLVPAALRPNLPGRARRDRR